MKLKIKNTFLKIKYTVWTVWINVGFIILHHWHASFLLGWKTMSPQNANNTILALFRLLAPVLNWCVISPQPPQNIRFIMIASIYLIQINILSLTILMPHVNTLKKKKKIWATFSCSVNVAKVGVCVCVCMRFSVPCGFQYRIADLILISNSDDICKQHFLTVFGPEMIFFYIYTVFVSFIFGLSAVFWLCADRQSWIEI